MKLTHTVPLLDISLFALFVGCSAALVEWYRLRYNAKLENLAAKFGANFAPKSGRKPFVLK